MDPADVTARLDALEQLLEKVVEDVATEIGGRKGERLLGRFREWRALIRDATRNI
jgi:tetrahydromethanopterin S-methyltransferase subunit G